jgi:hypothetical protein
MVVQRPESLATSSNDMIDSASIDEIEKKYRNITNKVSMTAKKNLMKRVVRTESDQYSKDSSYYAADNF